MYVAAHNIQAQFTSRQLNINVRDKSKSVEKLSSGYKINKAADNAAGLAISEKMRELIRGLNQGEENIKDGISLCEVADGAMAEVTDILQRIRELSIKAYNGTNSKSDKQCIQDEIDCCLEEINRMRESVEFNTIPLLKGNPQEGVTVSLPKQVVILDSRPVSANLTLPSWVYINDTPLSVNGKANDVYMERHEEYTDIKQDSSIDGIMYGDKDTLLYYGPDQGDLLAMDGRTYHWGGDWKDTMTDNLSAKIDFSKLSDFVENADDLYDMIYELLGTQLGFPCATRNSGSFYDPLEGVLFSGNKDDLSILGFDSISWGSSGNYQNINLSTQEWKDTDSDNNTITHTGYFDVIRQLQIAEVEENWTDEEKSTKAKALADKISSSLTEVVYDKLTKAFNNGHFDRVIPYNDDSLLVYDYRDVTKLSSYYAKNKISYNASVRYSVTYSTTKNIPASYALQSHPIQIIASSEVYDNIPINLPDISLEKLKLTDYSVTTGYVETRLSEEYLKKLKEWEDQPYTITYEQQWSKWQEPVTDQEKITEWQCINGEWTLVTIQEEQTHMEDKEGWKTVEVKTSIPKPQPGPNDYVRVVHEPSSVSILDDAIAYVSAARANIGATQNRLEHAYAYNCNAEENLQASESRIRDTDMTKEMVNYAIKNILGQYTESMLAQANHINDGVLNLLQGP